jgi:hypothetical protein
MSAAATAPSAASQPTGFRRLWRTLKVLFHELIGAAFAILALAWLNSAFRAWTRDVALWLIALIFAVALLFLYFALTSFRRARKL